MFKSIKRVTFYAICISLAIGGYIYTQSSHYTAFMASKMQEADNSSEEKHNEISEPNDAEAKSSPKDNGVQYPASTNTADYPVTEQDGFCISAPTQSHTPALQYLSSTNDVNSIAGDINSSNEGSTEISTPTIDFKNDVAFVNSELRIAPSSLSNAADYTAATSSTISSNASNASAQSRITSVENTASRVVGASNGGNTISFSPPPVIENPGGPNNGTDPYVPIDDYYGLFALLLCGGVIFWYRQKVNKLVKI